MNQEPPNPIEWPATLMRHVFLEPEKPYSKEIKRINDNSEVKNQPS
jgi:hypothetical protein